MSNVSERREVEFKLSTNGESVTTADVRRVAKELGLRLKEVPKIDQTDTYLDDAEYHLTRAGIGLRIRDAARKRLLCVKVEGRSRRGAFERDEIETELAGAAPSRPAELPDAVRDRIEPFTHRGKLRPIAVLHTRRRRLHGDGLEIAIDDVRVHDRGDEEIAAFREVEIEVVGEARRGDARRLAEALRTELGLESSSENKLRHALTLQHVTAGDERPLPIGPDVPIAEAARRMLLRHFRRMQRTEVRVRTSNSAGSVHKLRVACRRMRAALRTFKPWLPARERKAFRDLLRGTAQSVGNVRDLDVLADELKSRSDRVPEPLRNAARRIVQRLRDRSAAARERGRKALRSPDRIRKVARLQAFLEEAKTGAATPAVREAAPVLIRDAAVAAFSHGRTIGPGSDSAEIHELRILLKRLRYTAECFVEAYGKDLVRFVERTTHLQEVLGEFNDAAIAVDALAGLVREDRSLKRKELLAAGALMAIEHGRGTDARRRFEQVWSEFDTDDLRTWLAAVLRAPVGG